MSDRGALSEEFTATAQLFAATDRQLVWGLQVVAVGGAPFRVTLREVDATGPIITQARSEAVGEVEFASLPRSIYARGVHATVDLGAGTFRVGLG